MARPIPNTIELDLRTKTKKEIEDLISKESKSIFDISDNISSNQSKNFMLGTFSGWMAGLTAVRVGRVAAFGLGGGIILLHFASELGYISVNWDRVKETARRSSAWFDTIVRFIKRNSCYSLGFFVAPWRSTEQGHVARALRSQRKRRQYELERILRLIGFDSASNTALGLHMNAPSEERPPREGDVLKTKIVGASTRQVLSAKPLTPVATLEYERPLPPEPIPPKPPEPFKPEETNLFEPPKFFPSKPIPHSPKISPSSIPNPNPSVSTLKNLDSGYPNYGGFLYSIPGYSAFHPVNHTTLPTLHSSLVQPSQAPQPEPQNTDFVTFPQSNTYPHPTKDPIGGDESMDTDDGLLMVTDDEEAQRPPPQTDFEEHFTPEVISTISNVTTAEMTKPQPAESKMSIASLAQGSGATVTISQSLLSTKEIKKKPERFSLKTSIPISKIDMKCVSNPPDALFQTKKLYNTSFSKEAPRVEIQSNIVIKSASKEPEDKDVLKSVAQTQNTNLSTLLNAAEVVCKTDNQFRVPEPPKSESSTEVKTVTTLAKPLFNPMNIETNKDSSSKTSDRETFAGESRNQIVFIQNKNSNNQNPKMLLTIQPQSPQVLLQRTNFDSKNLQAPSRLPNGNKKSKVDNVNDGTSSKVVSLKRLHQENCDENDFENLITENQIYGNKIVVKEKSQGTQQEQDLKNKKLVTEKVTTEAKSVVLQPNFLYLSNVQFPNMMIVKNNTKVQLTDSNNTKVSNENKVVNETNITVPTSGIDVLSTGNKITKISGITKEIQALKVSNNVLQPLSNKVKPELIIPKNEIIVSTSDNIVKEKPDSIVMTKPDVMIAKPDLVIQTNQKVIMNPQIVYQVPVLVEGDKLNPSAIMNINSKEYPKFITAKKEYTKQFEPPKTNDKLYITCPYQMDSKLQPKIVITNLRPKMDEVSSLDVYEKRRRLRRLKYLSNRENNISNKDTKSDTNNLPLVTTTAQIAKKTDKTDFRNIITSEKMQKEIYKEFLGYKGRLDEEDSGSDSDEYDDGELKHYENIIEEYSITDKSLEDDKKKSEFLVNFRLASQETYKEQDLDLQERMLRLDRVRSAYAAIGRLDLILNESEKEQTANQQPEMLPINSGIVKERNLTTTRKKTMFLSRLKLTQVTQKFKEGYENAWQVILQERQRRNTMMGKDANAISMRPSLCLDTKGQLQIMSQIQQCVTENNNLIKKMMDTVREKQSNEESISVLAEKNFSELDRLSKMADRSVKLVSGQNMRKRDLNPGFDSENIQKQTQKIEQKFHNYPKLNIPDISKIISLKSTQECQSMTTTQATSMDEPRSSAAGANDIAIETTALPNKTVEASCQVAENFWPGIEYLLKSYKEYDAIRRREIAELHRRNTSLRVEGAHITRSASRDSDRARALLAERKNLAFEENNLRLSIQRLRNAIDKIKKYNK